MRFLVLDNSSREAGIGENTGPTHKDNHDKPKPTSLVHATVSTFPLFLTNINGEQFWAPAMTCVMEDDALTDHSEELLLSHSFFKSCDNYFHQSVIEWSTSTVKNMRWTKLDTIKKS
ncbi:unnamed protein product [Rhizophagus irregularis]|nr:unnamed protein product [Rhizophagus irregularis]